MRFCSVCNVHTFVEFLYLSGMLYPYQFLFIDLCLVTDTACTNGLKFNVHRIWYHNYWYLKMKRVLQTLSVLCFATPNQYFQENRWKFLPAILRPHLFFLILNSKIITNHPSWSSSATPNHSYSAWSHNSRSPCNSWAPKQFGPTKWLQIACWKKNLSGAPLCSTPPQKKSVVCHFFVSFKKTIITSSSFARRWPHPRPKQGLPLPTNKIFLSDLPTFLKNLPGWFTWKIPPKDSLEKSHLWGTKIQTFPFFGAFKLVKFALFPTHTFFGGSSYQRPSASHLGSPLKGCRVIFHRSSHLKESTNEIHINIAELPIGSISQFVAGFWGPNHLVRIIWGK